MTEQQARDILAPLDITDCRVSRDRVAVWFRPSEDHPADMRAYVRRLLRAAGIVPERVSVTEGTESGGDRWVWIHIQEAA
jgi:hypothetical protein